MARWNSPVCVLVSKNVLVVSTVIVANVPSMICAEESLLPRDRERSSLWDDCRRKFRQRIISSVVDCRRNPRAMRISSVVDWRRIITGAWLVGAGGALLQGEGSREEHVEDDSGDRGGIPRHPAPPVMEVDWRRSRPRRPRPTGDTSRSVPVRSGDRCDLESLRPCV